MIASDPSGKCRTTHIVKAIGEQWRQMSDAEKAAFEGQEVQAKAPAPVTQERVSSSPQSQLQSVHPIPHSYGLGASTLPQHLNSLGNQPPNGQQMLSQFAAGSSMLPQSSLQPSMQQLMASQALSLGGNYFNPSINPPMPSITTAMISGGNTLMPSVSSIPSTFMAGMPGRGIEQMLPGARKIDR